MSKIVKKTINLNKKLTKAEAKQVEDAARRPIIFDEDSPEYTYEELAEMAKLAKEKRAGQKKEIVTIRLSAATVQKAKTVGKGYTSFLGRLVENAMKDKDLVARSL